MQLRVGINAITALSSLDNNIDAIISFRFLDKKAPINTTLKIIAIFFLCYSCFNLSLLILTLFNRLIRLIKKNYLLLQYMSKPEKRFFEMASTFLC